MAGTVRRRLVAKLQDAAWRMSYFEGARLMSAWRKRWQAFRNPKATIRFGSKVRAGPGFKVIAPWGGTLIVGDRVEFRRNVLFELFGPETRITVGNDCHFTYDVIMQCATTVTIGDRVHLGQNTILLDGKHNYRRLDIPFLDQGFEFKPITISDDAVALSKVTIINNVGERSIIAANAVVTKPVPPFTVVGGVPAKVLEYFGPPGQEPEASRQDPETEAGGQAPRG